MRLTGESPLQLVRIRDNAFGYADLRDAFLRLIVIDQDFEEDFFSLADQLLADGGTFIDVGANHGLLSFGLAARHGSRIDFHLFEPNSILIGSIEKTKALYPSMRLTVNEAAVSDTPGVVSFEIDSDQSGASHISAAGSGIPVPCVSLDGYLEAKGISEVKLLKLDVEGYELPALRGATRALSSRTIRAVYFEYFEKWLQRVAPPMELIAFLEEAGFAVCFCRRGDLEARGGATHAMANNGIQLLPVADHVLPAMTDLMAVPKEYLHLIPI